MWNYKFLTEDQCRGIHNPAFRAGYWLHRLSPRWSKELLPSCRETVGRGESNRNEGPDHRPLVLFRNHSVARPLDSLGRPWIAVRFSPGQLRDRHPIEEVVE